MKVPPECRHLPGRSPQQRWPCEDQSVFRLNQTSILVLTGAWLHLLVGLPFLNGGRTVPHFQYTLHSTVLSTVCVTIKTEFLLPPSGSCQLHFLRHFQIPLAEALVRCQYLANSDQVLGDEISAQKYYNLIYFCPYAMNALLYCVLPNSIKCPR